MLSGPRAGEAQVLRRPQGPQQPCSLAASPVVKPLPSVVQALAEEEVLLPCEATGVPRPRITWQKEGFGIPTGGSPLRLVTPGSSHHPEPESPPERLVAGTGGRGSSSLAGLWVQLLRSLCPLHTL